MPNEEKIVEKKADSVPPEEETSDTDVPEKKEVPETYTITVDGTVREVTLDELRKMAELSGGAQKRFQEAAALAKENAKAMELYKIIRKGQEQPGSLTEEEWKRFAELSGIDPNELVAGDEEEEDDDSTSRTSSTNTPSPKHQETSPAKLPPEVMKQLEELQALLSERKTNAVVKEIETAVDKDEILGKIIKEYPDAERFVKDQVLREVQDYVIAQKKSYGPEVIQEALQYVRGVMNVVGKLATKKARTAFLMGAGPAEGGSLTSQQFATGKVPERVPVTDPNYEDVATQRFLAQYAKQG